MPFILKLRWCLYLSKGVHFLSDEITLWSFWSGFLRRQMWRSKLQNSDRNPWRQWWGICAHLLLEWCIMWGFLTKPCIRLYKESAQCNYFFPWEPKIALPCHTVLLGFDKKCHAVSCFFPWWHDTYTEYRCDNLSIFSKSLQGTEVGEWDHVRILKWNP